MMQRRAAAGLVVVALGLPSCGSSQPSQPSQPDNREAFQAILNGANTVPPTATNATGTANFTFDGSVISYTVEVADYPDLTAGHIHHAAAGVNGPILVNLYLGPTISVTTRRVVAQGTIGPADAIGITFADLLAEMRAGNTYVNMHTPTQGVGGFLRGQVRKIG